MLSQVSYKNRIVDVSYKDGVMGTGGTIIRPDSKWKINYARFEQRTADPVQGYSMVHADADPEKIKLSAPTSGPEYWADSIRRSRTQPASFSYKEEKCSTNLSKTYTRHPDGVRYKGDRDDHILRTETVYVTYKPSGSSDPRFVALVEREAHERERQAFLEPRGLPYYPEYRPTPNLYVKPSMSLNA